MDAVAREFIAATAQQRNAELLPVTKRICQPQKGIESGRNVGLKFEIQDGIMEGFLCLAGRRPMFLRGQNKALVVEPGLMHIDGRVHSETNWFQLMRACCG
jgi:hypothetical protein